MKKRRFVLAHCMRLYPDRDSASTTLILDHRAKVDVRRSEGIPVRILFNRAHHRRGMQLLSTSVIQLSFYERYARATASRSAAHSENAVNYR